MTSSRKPTSGLPTPQLFGRQRMLKIHDLTGSHRPENPVLCLGTRSPRGVRPTIQSGNYTPSKSAGPYVANGSCEPCRVRVVALVQNNSLICLRHGQTVPDLYNMSTLYCKRLILLAMAPRHGFEPRFTAPKAAVLPLDDRGIDTSFFSLALSVRELQR